MKKDNDARKGRTGMRKRAEGEEARREVYGREEKEERSNVGTSENYKLYAALNQPSKIIPVQPAAIMNM